MKKLIFAAILAIFAVTPVLSQNANRSGFFIEGGTGFLVGKAPISNVKWENNSLYVCRPGGPDVNLGFGYRRATSKVFAWEIKAEGSVVPNNVESTLVLAVMPGIRYTTKELFGNTSLYFGLNVGVACGSGSDANYFYTENGARLDNWYMDGPILPLNENGDWGVMSDFFYKFGAKLNLTAGINITSSFYAGLYWDFNFLTEQGIEFDIENESIKDGLGKWGSLGLRLGYRF